MEKTYSYSINRILRSCKTDSRLNCIYAMHPSSLTRLEKGNFGELIADFWFSHIGAVCISKTRITSLAELGHHGIDGTYYMYINSAKVYVVADAKYGSARLIKTKDGRQLSNSWIDKTLGHGGNSNRLVTDIGEAVMKEMMDELLGGQAILVRIVIHITNTTVSVDIVNADGYCIYRSVDFLAYLHKTLLSSS